MRTKLRIMLALIGALAMIGTLLVPPASAHEGPDDVVTDDPAEVEEEGGLDFHPAGDLGSPLATLDAANAGVISSGPSGNKTKNIDVRGIGARDVDQATTDVWALDGYAYTGTFGSPCGGSSGEAGVWVWDVSNANKTKFVTVIPSPTGSRSNDVRASTMNSGDVLVHSNEPCAAGGPGGFEIYNVDDPENPQFLAHVQTDDINVNLQPLGFTDYGVHNLWLFSQGGNDYVAATVESLFGNFQIYDITNPGAPTFVGSWGAEELGFPGVDFSTESDFNLLGDAQDYMNDGFGASSNRFLHDVTISADGTRAYLANWDAGLVLLDISDPTNPSLVSVAIDPINGSLDGEVNSHSVWPSEDGTIVVEGEEDFAPFESLFTIDSGANAGEFASVESNIGVPIASLPGETMTGATTYVGLACAAIPPGDGIALIQRGGCAFTTKLNNAADAGYTGAVVFNSEAGGDNLVIMGGDPVPIPGVFVGRSTGLLIAGVATAGDLVEGDPGANVSASVVPNAWSGLRIWDYSDESNPVLMSLFDTVCSANPVDASCDPAGTYSVHNVVVETTGNKTKAYVSWYSDGMLVLDVSDPANPVEIGRYTEAGTDFWGVYKEPNSPFFYGSDRNGGLYVFKEQGSGSGK